jgi:membrane-associated phospholipid phosphatase
MDWGTDWILWLQRLGPDLAVLSRVFSALGSEYFYFLIMPAILWCVDSGLGIRMGLLVVTSAGVNDLLKIAFGLPRPYWISREIAALSSEASFGLPSGHAQTSVVVWGRLAAWARRRWFAALAVITVLGISLSRLALGVHFPLDIAAGWIAGAVLLGLALWLEEPLSRIFANWSLLAQLGAVTIVSLSLVGLGALALQTTAGRPAPESWVSTAAAQRPGDEAIQPRVLEGIVARAGALLGIGVGAVMLRANQGLRPAASLAQAVGRYAVGAFGAVVLFVGLRAVFPTGEDFAAALLRYLRYAMVAVWIAYGAPRIFVHLNLA